MKKSIPLLLVAAATLMVAGCRYEAPLATEHTISIDPLILGLWEYVPAPESNSASARLLVLKYSETEYLIHYPAGDDGYYFRGYPIKVGGAACIQLEMIGCGHCPHDPEEKNRFDVASYSITDGIMEVGMLNADLVNDLLKDTDALRKVFMENIGKKDLFKDPISFRKVDK